MTQGILAVLGLVTRLGVLNHYLVWLVGEWVDEFIVQTHAGLHFVHILSSGTRRAEGIPTDGRWVHMDVDSVVNQGNDEYTGKTGHAFTLCVVWAHAHKAVYAVLALEVTVRHIAFYVKGDGLDACFIALL